MTVYYVETETVALDTTLNGNCNSSTGQYIIWRLKQQHLTVHYVETETAALDSTLCGD